MSARVSQARRTVAGRLQPAVFVGVLAGVVIGREAVVSARTALGLMVFVMFGAAFARRSAAMLTAMIASTFVEAISLGGVTVDRLLTPVALLALLLALLKGDAKIRYGRPVAWMLGYSLWAVASMAWTASAGATTNHLASLGIALVYSLGFAGWISSKADLRRVLTSLAVVSCLVGLFTIFTFASHGSLATKAGRASGGVGDPNFFAAYQVIVLPVLLVYAGEKQGWARRGLYLAVLVAVGSVLVTVSRGGLIALGVIVLLMLLSPSSALFRSGNQKKAASVAILIAAGIGFIAIAPSLNQRLAKSGGSGRVVLWEGAFTALRAHALTGIGYGAYQSESIALIYRTPADSVSLQTFDIPPGGQVTHSAYIGTAAELGLPGLVLFLGLLISTGLTLRRISRRARAAREWFISRAAYALAIGLVGWAVASIFLSSETSRPLWIVVGISLALPKLLERATAQR